MMKSRVASVAVGTLASLGLGWAIGSSLPVAPTAAEIGQPVAIPGAAGLVTRLEDLAPYDVVLPDLSGATVENVMWDDPEGEIFSFDLWWRTADGVRMHLWESNIADLREKDPTVGGTVHEIAGQEWHLTELPADAPAEHSLSVRLANGVLVSMDTQGEQQDLLVAASNLKGL